jgi:hypothetical protein
MILPNQKDENQKPTIHKTQRKIRWFEYFEILCVIHQLNSLLNKLTGAELQAKRPAELVLGSLLHILSID